MAQLETLKIQLGKPYFDLEFLLNCFHEVLIENNEPELAQCIPWISGSGDYADILPVKTVRRKAYGASFWTVAVQATPYSVRVTLPA